MKETLIFVVIVIIMLILTASGACDVSDRDMARLMRQEGITEYKNEGHAYFSCGRDDTFGSEFSGVKNGQPVKGSICGGLMKDYTVRYK